MRRYKTGIDRNQAFLLPPRVDDYVQADNPVRAIDVYIDSLDLTALGFKNAAGDQTIGQPAYPPAALLKLYLYGYLHQTRSSRRLEQECQRNLEVIWLMQGLRPCYKTIADFRKDNLEALKAANRDFVQVCKELDLYGKELVAIDGSFFRGNVGKRKIYTKDRLKMLLERVDKQIETYLQELERADADEEQSKTTDLQKKLETLKERQKKHHKRLAELESGTDNQIAEVDEDARMLSRRGQGTVAGYNVQIAVDEKHKLLVVGEVVQDGNDAQQLAPMGKAAKAQLGVEKLTTVQDQGYFNAQQIKECQENGIIPYVPEPNKLAHARKQGRFTRDDFIFDTQTNCYICPAKQMLNLSTTHHHTGKKVHQYRSQSSVCRLCALQAQCLPQNSRRRTVSRWEHEGVIEIHRERMKHGGADKMRQRAELCEHPFGTFKLWFGWTHFLLRGLEKVRSEFNLLMLCYNFKRVQSILGLEVFRAYCLSRRSLKPVIGS